MLRARKVHSLQVPISPNIYGSHRVERMVVSVIKNLSVLRGRNVVLFPDVGATENWASKIQTLEHMGITVKLFDYLERNATKKQSAKGFDIADFLLEMKQPQAILQGMISRNPSLKTLIYSLGLELIKVKEHAPKPIKKRGLKM